MAAIVVIKVRRNANGRPSTRQMQLLGTNDIEERGPIQYSFPPELVRILQNTQIFARLHTRVMFELSSKYSLALYELLQRRKNLRHIDHETLSVEEVRGMLGVAAGKLKAFGHLNDKAIRPAAQEVSFLTDYDIIAEPVRSGRTVTHIRFAWSKKRDVGAQIAAVEELERSQVGREARMRGEAQAIGDITSSQKSDSSPKVRTRLSHAELDEGRRIVREARSPWCIYEIAEQFHAYAAKDPPKHFRRAWLGFVKRKIEVDP
ncbi:MAG: replication initiation protein [Pseudomonadota bacterium]